MIAGRGRRPSLVAFLAASLGACRAYAPDTAIDDVVLEPIPWNPMGIFVRVTPPTDMEVTVQYGAAGRFDYETPPKLIPGGSTSEVEVLGLVPQTRYQYRVVGTGAQYGWAYESKVQELASGETYDFQAPAITTNETAWPREEVVCSTARVSGIGPINCMDRSGRPRLVLDNLEGGPINLFQALSDGTFAGMSDAGAVFWDSSGQVIGGFDKSAFEGRTRFVHESVDGHELLPIIEGPWAGAFAILTTTEDVDLDGDTADAHGIVVYDPKSDTVLWDWSVHGELGDGVPIDPEMLDYDRKGLAVSPEDWDHANALLHGLDADGGDFFWMSMRHQDWLVKIDVDTDLVVWRFGREGDFTMLDDEGGTLGDEWYMYQQHAPEWVSHEGSRYRFLVYDNGENRMGPDGLWDGEKYTRIMEYELDEASREAWVRFAYGSPDTQDPSHFYGSNYGDANMSPEGDAIQFVRQGDNPYLCEISYPEGEVVWKAAYEESDTPQHLYRLAWFPSVYETTWDYEDP